MKLAFLIERKNYYRLLGPIVDEALRQGWEVECWHDYNQPRTGGKGYEFPAIEAAPTFVYGKPVFKIYHGPPELKNWMLHNSVDAVVSLNTPLSHFGAQLPNPSPKWISIQHTGDFFHNNGPEGILSCDVAALYSDWWLTWGITYFREEGLTHPGDRIERQIATKAVSVGFPEVDQCRLIDPAEVRRRWGIPQEQPVVALLPYPANSNPNAFWSRRIYSEPSRLKQIGNILFRGRFDYWTHIQHGWNDVNVVKAIKIFCDRNGAYLIVKSRLKDPIPAYTEAMADKCLYDESHYPHTILEVLSIASLCINFYSSTVTEAAYVGAPNLCITLSTEDWYDTDQHKHVGFELLFNTREGGLFQFCGVSTTMSIPEVIETLPQKSLAHYRMDPRARSAYVEKFLSYDDGQSSRRVLDAIRQVVRQ